MSSTACSCPPTTSSTLIASYAGSRQDAVVVERGVRLELDMPTSEHRYFRFPVGPDTQENRALADAAARQYAADFSACSDDRAGVATYERTHSPAEAQAMIDMYSQTAQHAGEILAALGSPRPYPKVFYAGPNASQAEVMLVERSRAVAILENLGVDPARIPV